METYANNGGRVGSARSPAADAIRLGSFPVDRAVEGRWMFSARPANQHHFPKGQALADWLVARVTSLA
jgi:hypothetical protein